VPEAPGLLVIRADAGPDLGLGHVLRCLALAQAWRGRGGRVLFAGRIAAADLAGRLAAEGMGVVDFPEPREDAGPAALDALLRARQEPGWADPARPAWVVLDGYLLGGGWQSGLRGLGCRVLAVEDFPRVPRCAAHLLLDHGLGAEERGHMLAPGGRLLAGPAYRLLRREFLERRPTPRPAPERARRLLVTLGGADKANVSLLAISALQDLGNDAPAADVVVGGANPHLASLEAQAARGGNISLVRGADMPGLMAQADLALTAGGGACCELAFMGVPMLAVVVADNQAEGVRHMARAGMLRSLGRREDLDRAALAAALAGAAADRALRQRLSDAGRTVVDGRGPERVVDAMLAVGD